MLAIIIPYYKLTFFKATLLSLASQSNQQFIVYIGDDASPENPIDLLEKYKGQFDFEYHRFESNLGRTSLTQQWERCIALSGDEEWIMILGDDDVLVENVVEEFYANLREIENEGINVVRYATQTIDGYGLVISGIYEHPKLEKSTDFLFRKFKGLTRSSLSEYVFWREAYTKYKFRNYPLGWHSDDIAWIDFTVDKPVYTINKSKVFIRMSNLNISGKMDNEILKEQASILFFKDLIKEKLYFFKREERYRLLIKYEQKIKKTNKPDLMEWVFLLRIYFLNFRFIPFVKLIKRIFISYFASETKSAN
jgi:hypothetical protein